LRRPSAHDKVYCRERCAVIRRQENAMRMELPRWPSRFRKSYPNLWKAFQHLGHKEGTVPKVSE
jgi:hypothetical protein